MTCVMSDCCKGGIAAVAVVVGMTAADASAAMVGVDDHYWGESVGSVTSSYTGSEAIYAGSLDASTVQNWVDGTLSNFGVAFIPAAPDYTAASQWPMAQNNFGEPKLTLTFDDNTTAEVANGWLADAAVISASEPDQNIGHAANNDNWSVTVSDATGDGPAAILYKFPGLTSHAGKTVTDVAVDIRSNWTIDGLTYHAYVIPEDWDDETVTWGNLVPEPASLAVVGLGALAMLRRRR